MVQLSLLPLDLTSEYFPRTHGPRGTAAWILRTWVCPLQQSGDSDVGVRPAGGQQRRHVPWSPGFGFGGSEVGLVREMRPGASRPETPTPTPSPSPRSLSCCDQDQALRPPSLLLCAPRGERRGSVEPGGRPDSPRMARPWSSGTCPSGPLRVTWGLGGQCRLTLGRGVCHLCPLEAAMWLD